MDSSSTLVTIFGGSGFVGTQIVQVLARRGYRLRVAVRRPDLAGHVRPLGMVGQVMPIQANIRDADSVARAVGGARMVINLVGIGHEAGRQRFRAVHIEGAANVARAAAAAGVEHVVHMSALGADTHAPSAYARSKAEGEAKVLEAFPQAVVMRPSIIFGQGDGFFNLMGFIVRLFPVVPLIGGRSRFQPVFVGDVADAFVAAAEGKAQRGRIYELGGPELATYRDLMQRVLRETRRRNMLVPVPAGVGKLLALPFAILPFPPLLTADQVDQMQADNIVSEAASGEGRILQGLGIQPTAMEAILPSYLWRFRRHGQFDREPIQQYR
jgi:NADH dehydrogenase